MTATGTVLFARGIEKSFQQPDGRILYLLRGIDIEVRSGEKTAITGVSGSGKSTLLHILGTLDQADRGELRFFDLDLKSLREREIAEFRNSRLGFVFQFHYLIGELTLLENVALPFLLRGQSLKKVAARAMESLDLVGLAERRDHYPYQLSGGEKQRAAIARAMIGSPELILADEPTGNLDSATARSVFNCLLSAIEGRKAALVIVTHNERLAAECDSVFTLREGKIAD